MKARLRRKRSWLVPALVAIALVLFACLFAEMRSDEPTLFDLHPWLAPIAVAAVVVAVLVAVLFTGSPRFISNPREPSKEPPRATTAPPSGANSQPLSGQDEEGIESSASGRPSTERPPGANSSSSPWGPIVTPPPARITVACPGCGGHLRLPSMSKHLVVTCPHCQHRFDLPSGTQAEGERPSEPLPPSSTPLSASPPPLELTPIEHSRRGAGGAVSKRRATPKGAQEAVVHEVAGGFDQWGRAVCILCGKVLLDYSDAQVEFDGTYTKRGEPERPLPPGPVTVTTRRGGKHTASIKVGAAFGVPRCTQLRSDAGPSAPENQTLSGSRMTYEQGAWAYRVRWIKRELRELEEEFQRRGVEPPARRGAQEVALPSPPYLMTTSDLGGALLAAVFEDATDIAYLTADLRDANSTQTERSMLFELRALSHAAIESAVRVFASSDADHSAVMEAHYLFLRGYLRDAAKVGASDTDWTERFDGYLKRRAGYAHVVTAARGMTSPGKLGEAAGAVFSRLWCGTDDRAVEESASVHFSDVYDAVGDFLTDVHLISGGWDAAVLDRLRHP